MGVLGEAASSLYIVVTSSEEERSAGEHNGQMDGRNLKPPSGGRA